MPLSKRVRSPFFWYDFRYRGRRYRGSTKETNKAAARHFEAQMIADLEKGDELASRGRHAPLLRDFMPQFLTSFDNNQLRDADTKRYYHNGSRLLLNTPLAEFPIDRITTSIVAAVPFPHSASNRNNAIRTLRRALGHAVEVGFLCVVPKMHLFPEIAREMTWTPEQEELFLEKAPQPLSDVYVLSMDFGMRPEEIYRLRWEWIDWTKRMLSIPGGKTSASKRELAISDRALGVLQRRSREQAAHKWWKDSPWVFTSRRRRKEEIQHIASVNKAFVATRRSLGLSEELVLYSARHTFGTEFFAATKDLKKTMKVMGHVDMRTALKYQHPDTADVGDLINARNRKREATRNGMLDELSPDRVNILDATDANEKNFRSLRTVWTLREAAAYLKLDRRTVRQLAERKNIPARQIGPIWRFYRDELENLPTA